MKDPGIPLEEISEALGFEHERSIYKLLKKVGIKPWTKYRAGTRVPSNTLEIIMEHDSRDEEAPVKA